MSLPVRDLIRPHHIKARIHNGYCACMDCYVFRHLLLGNAFVHSRGSFHGSLRRAGMEAPENHEQEQEEQQQVTACCKGMDWTHT